MLLFDAASGPAKIAICTRSRDFFFFTAGLLFYVENGNCAGISMPQKRYQWTGQFFSVLRCILYKNRAQHFFRLHKILYGRTSYCETHLSGMQDDKYARSKSDAQSAYKTLNQLNYTQNFIL